MSGTEPKKHDVIPNGPVQHRSSDIMQLIDDADPELQREGINRIVGWLEEIQTHIDVMDENDASLQAARDDIGLTSHIAAFLKERREQDGS